ncbi:15132_t:CDS:2, partial [Gigaspora margarita]
EHLQEKILILHYKSANDYTDKTKTSTYYQPSADIRIRNDKKKEIQVEKELLMTYLQYIEKDNLDEMY